MFSTPILHLDAHHWWPTVTLLGKSVWANRCSCVGSPSLRTTGAGLSSTVIYSSIFSSASSGHDFTQVPPTVSSASHLLLTHSVPPAHREWRSRLHAVHRFRWVRSSSTSLSLFSELLGGVFVTIPIKRRNIDLGQVHHAFIHCKRSASPLCHVVLSFPSLHQGLTSIPKRQPLCSATQPPCF